MYRRRNKPAYDWRGISEQWMKTELKSGHWWDQFVKRSTAIPPLPRTTAKAEWRVHSETYRKLERLKSWPGSRAFKQWSGQTSVCPKCGREISNREYWSGKQGGTHFRGECKPDKFFIQKLPLQSWKMKLAYPMPSMPTYAGEYTTHLREKDPINGFFNMSKTIRFHFPTTMKELAKWWGVPMHGKTMFKRLNKGGD